MYIYKILSLSPSKCTTRCKRKSTSFNLFDRPTQKPLAWSTCLEQMRDRTDTGLAQIQVFAYSANKQMNSSYLQQIFIHNIYMQLQDIQNCISFSFYFCLSAQILSCTFCTFSLSIYFCLCFLFQLCSFVTFFFSFKCKIFTAS